jgi:3-deoxy-D-manno-octulosonic-acid transferase
VGEILTAVPVVERLRAAKAGLNFILSYSSPSAAEWPASALFERSDYVPPDDPRVLDPLLSALRPAAILFSRGDLWPNLVELATSTGTSAILAAGSISPKSLRLRGPARRWLRRFYSRLDLVAAATRSDAARFVQLGARRGTIAVTGDPRHDYATERPVSVEQIRPFIDWAAGDPVIVAGSTDSADEQLATRAFLLASQTSPAIRLVLVPHEPKRAAEVWRASSGCVLWKGEPQIPRAARVVVVGKLGLLADLYLVAAIAHVGGGFQRSGVHSVIEPAVFAIPVSFGPNHRNSPEAVAMLHRGGAACVSRAGAARELADRWVAWLRRPTTAATAGRRNREVLRLGAAAITARAVLGLLRSRGLRNPRR